MLLLMERQFFDKAGIGYASDNYYVARNFSFYQMKSVSQKMGIKENSRTLFMEAPAEALKDMQLPELEVKEKLTGTFDYIHLFAKTQSEFRDRFPKLKTHLKPDGMLWVSWPKGGQLDTDLSLTKIIKIGYGFGLVESTCLSVNSVWSGLKFTHPKEGKVYRNSYGDLVR